MQQDITLVKCTKRLNGLKIVYEFCMQEQIEDIKYITQKQFDRIQNYADTAYELKCAMHELRSCQRYIFCHAKKIPWDSTVWYMERLYLEEYRLNPANPVKTLSFMNTEKKENREILQEYMKYCLGVTHLSINSIQEELFYIQAFAMWLEESTETDLKNVSEDEMQKYFQVIGSKKASHFNDIVVTIHQLYVYLQTKGIIKQIPFNYQYYLKKQVLHHNNRSVKMEIYETILSRLKDFPEVPRLILLHSMLLGLRISEVCCLKGNAYYWQGRDAWIQVYQIKMRTYKRIPIPEVLYKIMKVYIKKYDIGSEDYVFQNKKGGAYHYGSFKFQIKKIFDEDSEIYQEYDFKSHDFRHTMLYSSVQGRITWTIHNENLRDDAGNYFTFGTHMYRHVYGVKLAEMHLDDWTIARLLGHKSLKNVKYYRKMSNMILANDTRKTRNRLSQMVLECLDGWEEEYEQIRYDDSL